MLRINNLTTSFKINKEMYPAVRDINIELEKGETLCIVGESGSGKTITSLSLMQLLPANGEISSGEIIYKDQNITKFGKNKMNKLRGKSISMIFQDPMSALDPVYTCGYQIKEVLDVHENYTNEEKLERVISLLKQVGIPHPKDIYNAYPHELSGGMCQRVVIAMALACDPDLLIADEPTTALDVTIQAKILKLLNDLKKERNLSILLITHDLGVVAEMADKVIVMYAGEVVEAADVNTLFDHPKHPYTKGLIGSVSSISSKGNQLYSIPGKVPSVTEMPKGCRFNTRCPIATERCFEERPELESITNHSSQEVRCWNVDTVGGKQNESTSLGNKKRKETLSCQK